MNQIREIEPEILQRLGALIVASALIETSLSNLFTRLSEGEFGLMHIVTANVSQSTLSGWIRTLLDVRPSESEDFKNEIRDILIEADEIRAERNALVHGLWSTENCEPGSVIVQTVRLDRAEIVKGEVVTAADLDELIDRIKELWPKLKTVLNTMGVPA